MTDPERLEQQPEPITFTITSDGMILAGTIRYVATQRQIDLMRALGSAPGEFLTTDGVNEVFLQYSVPEATTDNIQRWMNGMERFSRGLFESKKEENKMYFRVLPHVSVIEELPAEQ